MRRLALAAAVGAAVVGTAVPTLAAQTTASTMPPPVGITNNDGTICVWISEQVPHCVSTKPVTDAIPEQWDAGPVSVDVSTANGGVAVGTALDSQPLVGASLGNGWVCVGFGTEVPYCYPLASQN